MNQSKYNQRMIFCIVVAVLVIMLNLDGCSEDARAIAPYPQHGRAVVDGDASEWRALDYYASIYLDSDAVANLFARYDCDAYTAYVYVAPDTNVSTPAGVHSVHLNYVHAVSVQQGPFAFVQLPDRTAGWEASFPVDPGRHSLRVSVQVARGAARGVASSGNLDFIVDCPVAAKLQSIEAADATGLYGTSARTQALLGAALGAGILSCVAVLYSVFRPERALRYRGK